MKMRERRYVKFKLDIYDDTKTKIIDQRLERDFIHYFFARSIILAAKSDCEGKLYMAKDIPYTIETLAIEFGRDTALIKLALDLLIELKMIEVTEDNIYRVKNFVKHQNIKVKEDAKANHKEYANDSERNKGMERKDIIDVTASNKEVEIKEDEQVEESIREKINIQEECKKQNNEIQEKNEDQEITRDNRRSTDIAGANMGEAKINTKQENTKSNSEQDNLVVLEMKDNKKSKKKKKGESDLVTELAVEETEDDQPILLFSEGDMPPLVEGERLVWGLTPV